MNLFKVYSTQDTFQAEDIIRAKLTEAPFFDSSLITGKLGGSGTARQEFRPDPVRQQPILSSGDATAEKDEPPTSDRDEQPADPPPPQPEKKAAEQPVAPEIKPAAPIQPPGISPAEVKRMVAEAYDKGCKDGLKQADQDFGAATAALQLVCEQLDTLRETILHNSIGEIQELVIAIAEKVIRHSVQEQSQTIVDTVEDAIQKAVKSGEFYIYVNPEDHAIISEKAQELVAGINGLSNIVVKKDGAIDRGGCRLESDNCTVDATVISQLEIIRKHLQTA